jgi:anti-sigma-K factor RskA
LNIQNYISSGVLESYVLGQLSNDECAKIIALSKQHPEILNEIESIEHALLQAASKTPPAHIKSSILSQINTAADTIVTLPNKKNNFTVWLAAASILVLLASFIYNFILFDKVKSKEVQLAILSSEKEALNIASLESIKKITVLNSDITMLTEVATKKIILKATDSLKKSMATIYWNVTSKSVYLTIHSLAKPANDKQYQLWAIVGGLTINAGIFDAPTKDNSLQKMLNIENAEAFAVTIENKGGSPTPTLSTMCLMGAI